MTRRPDSTPVVVGFQRLPGGRVDHLVVRYPDGRGGALQRHPCGAHHDPTAPVDTRTNLAPVCGRCAAAAVTFPRQERPRG